jgi:hypothetical protein
LRWSRGPLLLQFLYLQAKMWLSGTSISGASIPHLRSRPPYYCKAIKNHAARFYFALQPLENSPIIILSSSSSVPIIAISNFAQRIPISRLIQMPGRLTKRPTPNDLIACRSSKSPFPLQLGSLPTGNPAARSARKFAATIRSRNSGPGRRNSNVATGAL